jgi:pimeloyl-ACP methyl ester carboxylesterase
MATFVLVAGACCGGWSWNRVAPPLRAAGHDVFTPTPTGLGERVHLAGPKIDLDTHITDVVNLLFYEDLRDATLVAFSMGCCVTGVAERAPERLARLVFLDAVVPQDGESEYDADNVSTAEREADRTTAERAGCPGCWPIPTDYIREQIADPVDRAWFLERLIPHPIGAFVQPVRVGNPAAAALPRAYIYCMEGKGEGSSSRRFAARYRTAPGWCYREIAANHLAPITAPESVAGALLSLVS